MADDRVTIRAATAADAAAIARVHTQSWRQAYEGVVPAEYLASLSVGTREEALREWFARKPTEQQLFWVAECGADIVGFAQCGPTKGDDPGPEGEVYTLYVLREMWGTGVGPSLFRAACAALKANGFEDLILWVLARNARARRFYEKAGWVPDGGSEAHFYGGVELEALRYRLPVMTDKGPADQTA